MKRLLAAFIVMSCGCVASPQRWQAEVDASYPPDCIRLDILENRGNPMKTHPVSDRHEDKFADGSIRNIEANSGAVVAYWDYYLTPRGWFGLWGDYLFYTKDDVLITARRRFLD
jgi:hypothetical protein